MIYERLSSEQPIGIFDSGVGGLTVLQEIWKQLPYENIIYLADNANNPIGNLSEKRILDICKSAMQFFISKRVKIIVIACNTATAVALDHLQIKCPVPVIGVIDPGVQELINRTRNNQVGIIATRGTIRTNAHGKMLAKKSPQINLTKIEAPLLAPLIEEGRFHFRSTEILLEEYLSPIYYSGIDTLLLGCTHYPLLKEKIQKIVPDISLIDPSCQTAKQVSMILEEMSLVNPLPQYHVEIYCTDISEPLIRTQTHLFGQLFEVMQISLNEKTEVQECILE